MPYFDVKFYYPRTNRPEYRIAASLTNSTEEAIERVGCFFGNTVIHVDCAIPLKHEWDTMDHDYWFKKWRDAVSRMPAKQIKYWTISWVQQSRGDTPLPDFIKGRAKGKMKMIDGHIHVMKRHTNGFGEVGRFSALAIILGYTTTDGAKTKRPRADSKGLMHAIERSSRPRDPKKRKLLALLPHLSPDTIINLLARKRKAMKRGRI